MGHLHWCHSQPLPEVSAFSPNPRPSTPAFPSKLNSNVTCLGPIYLMCQTKPGSLSEVPLTSHTSLSHCLLPLQLYSYCLKGHDCLVHCFIPQHLSPCPAQSSGRRGRAVKYVLSGNTCLLKTTQPLPDTLASAA